MSPIGDTGRGWNAAAQNNAARRLALQKASAASRLTADSGDEAPPQSPSFKNAIVENLRHSGTNSSVPFRHIDDSQAPRLTSAFVAQLLGQILPETGSRQLEARTAYKRADAPMCLLLDTRL